MMWYFDMESDAFGSETFGPYEDRAAATIGILKVMDQSRKYAPEVKRWFSAPYEKGSSNGK